MFSDYQLWEPTLVDSSIRSLPWVSLNPDNSDVKCFSSVDEMQISGMEFESHRRFVSQNRTRLTFLSRNTSIELLMYSSLYPQQYQNLPK